jgi:RNA polymerase sigma-70 factor, ECF subfamily
MTNHARQTAEAAARVSYGRLIAMLSSRSRDIAAAEDALSTAFVAALRTWPDRGVPANPDAWLLTAARNAIRNDHRHRAIIDASLADLRLFTHDAEPMDPRLNLLFVCAHPAIDAAARTPLMLQTVLGLDAATIAQAFITSPTAMAQRLVRAKTRIRDTGLRFALPDLADMPDRLADVLAAIYAAFGTGWDRLDGTDGLTDEAIYLAGLLVDLLPQEPEPKGLLALMLYADARKAARRKDGLFVPLRDQDASLWSRDAIIRAEGLLTEAARMARFGRYQCEAAIQSVHVQRAFTGRTNHAALAALYAHLVDLQPTLGVLVAQAATLLDAGDAAGALAMLDGLGDVDGYQPYWVTHAHCLQSLGRDAQQSVARALALTKDPAIRTYLTTVFNPP